MQPIPRSRSPGRPSLGVRFPFRAELRLGCPRSGFVAPTYVDAASLSSPGIASPGVLSPLEHIDVGCPLSHPPRACARSREGEGYQALTGAVLRVLAPLDGSGCTRGTHDQTPCGICSPFAVVPRRFAALFHAARAHWSRPSELSLPEEPYPLSRASFSLVSSLGLPNSADRSEGFAAPFADRADFSPQLTRGPTGLKKPGRRFPGVARAPHVSRCRGRLQRLVSERPGSPDSAARTLTSELYSPRESVRGY